MLPVQSHERTPVLLPDADASCTRPRSRPTLSRGLRPRRRCRSASVVQLVDHPQGRHLLEQPPPTPRRTLPSGLAADGGTPTSGRPELRCAAPCSSLLVVRASLFSQGVGDLPQVLGDVEAVDGPTGCSAAGPRRPTGRRGSCRYSAWLLPPLRLREFPQADLRCRPITAGGHGQGSPGGSGRSGP